MPNRSSSGCSAAGELDGDRDVVAGVRPEAVARRRVVVAVDAGVQRHDEAVLGGHPRHLHEHVPPERGRLRLGHGLPDERRRVDPRGLGRLERQGDDVGVAVVGRDAAVRLEEAAPVLERGEVAGVGGGVDVGGDAQRLDELGEVGAGRLEVAVGPEGGQRPGSRSVGSAAQAGGGARGRRPGRRSWPAPRSRTARPGPAGGTPASPAPRRPRRRCASAVAGRRALGHAEDVRQHALEPEPARGAAEGRPVLAEQPPGAPRRRPRPAAPRRRRGRRAARPGRAAAGRRSGPARSSSDVGSANGMSSASHCGGTCPCGEMIGSGAVAAYSRRAMSRVRRVGGQQPVGVRGEVMPVMRGRPRRAARPRVATSCRGALPRGAEPRREWVA